MKKQYFLVLLFPLFLINACTEIEKEDAPAFDLTLTDSEIENGVMSPEILWKFGRVGSMELSPDGSTILYTVSNYDLPSEASRTNIYSIPTEGGDPVQLTSEGGGSPLWIEDGERIIFTSSGKLLTMNPDGSDRVQVTFIE